MPGERLGQVKLPSMCLSTATTIARMAALHHTVGALDRCPRSANRDQALATESITGGLLCYGRGGDRQRRLVNWPAAIPRHRARGRRVLAQVESSAGSRAGASGSAGATPRTGERFLPVRRRHQLFRRAADPYANCRPVLLAACPYAAALRLRGLDLCARGPGAALPKPHGQEALSKATAVRGLNRRFECILHDIKNLVSQLSLLSRMPSGTPTLGFPALSRLKPRSADERLLAACRRRRRRACSGASRRRCVRSCRQRSRPTAATTRSGCSATRRCARWSTLPGSSRRSATWSRMPSRPAPLVSQ